MKYDDSHKLMSLFEGIVKNDPDMVASDEVTEGHTSYDGDDIDDPSEYINSEADILGKMKDKYGHGNKHEKSLISDIITLMVYIDKRRYESVLNSVNNKSLLADVIEFLRNHGNYNSKFSNLATPGRYNFDDVRDFHEVDEGDKPDMNTKDKVEQAQEFFSKKNK